MPVWNARGVIEPTSAVAGATNRSPYRVKLIDVVEALATSAARIEILKGLLRYRHALASIGLVSGFQWLDGSFLEHVELLERRDPRDIDVVTFYELPVGDTQLSLRAKAPHLFPGSAAGQEALKKAYLVDGYFQLLSARPANLVERTTYWYSMWAHRRDLTWKGFVEVDLSPTEDTAAVDRLDELSLQLASAPVAKATGAQNVGPATGVAP